MSIRPLPPVPTRDDPANFALKGDAFLAALPEFRNDCNALIQSLQLVATTGTSTSSLTVSLGSKSLTTDPGKAWATGAWLYVFAAAAVSNYMVGRVTSYDVDTGALVVNVSAIDGSGTHGAWIIGLATPAADGHLLPRDGTRGMTAELPLSGNAVNALGAVPKQQLEAAIAAAARPDLSSLAVAVASNAMTCTLPAETLNFRSSDLTSGAVFARTYAGGSLTVPSGATLGTTNGAPARIVWGLIDNAGTPEPFVVNVGGTANLDETTLISTTAISGSANSASTFYSQTARTNVAFRIRGWCDVTQATAGTWATAPTKVAGASIQTLKAIQGRGRTPQNMLGQRTFGVTYYNTTGAELFAHVNIQWTSGVGAARLTVDGINFDGPILAGANETSQVNAPVPPGGGYVFNGTNSIGFTFLGWNESRQG